jgi:ATP-dependent Lon protease
MRVIERLAGGPPPPELPWLALRDVVLFPDALTEILVGRPASAAALQAANDGDGWLAVLAQRDAAVDDPGPEDLHPVGCAARLLALRACAKGDGVAVVLQPVGRVRAAAWLPGPPRRVRCEHLPAPGGLLDAMTSQVIELLAVAGLRHSRRLSRREAERYVAHLPCAAHRVWVAAAYLALDVADHQALLECEDVGAAARRLLSCRDDLVEDGLEPWWRRTFW